MLCSEANGLALFELELGVANERRRKMPTASASLHNPATPDWGRLRKRNLKHVKPLLSNLKTILPTPPSKTDRFRTPAFNLYES